MNNNENIIITAGIDIGSLSTKAVILEGDKIKATHVELTGGDNVKTGKKVFDIVLSKAGFVREQIKYVISTGYGRENLNFFDANVTEITCHAAGIYFLFPKVRTILDLGGQDSKAIKIDDNGAVIDFVMNDKCAAGTGRFLELVSRWLQVDLSELGELSRKTDKTVTISSMCSVFAETEVVSLITKRTPIPEIIRGLHSSIAERSINLLKRVNIKEDVAMSGGVAKNIGVVDMLENKLGLKIMVAEDPQIIGALGAAIIAQKKLCSQRV
jgi:predicted CoA-substrate-specific enzyme activase